MTPTLVPAVASHVDPHPFWGGIEIGIAALVVFLAFATWVVVQRIRHGRGGNDDD